MRPQAMKLIAHVAPAQGGFGIRLRYSRNSSGVWLGQGAKETPTNGGKATQDGWRWEKQEDAEEALKRILEEAKKHSFDE